MDQDLQRLAREARAHPGDGDVARRYDQALRRAGRDEEVRARFRFKLLCSLRYDDLTPTDDPLTRACSRCRRTVRFVDSPAALAEQVAQGQCVAFHKERLEDVIAEVSSDPRQHSARTPGSPCLVPTDLPWVAIDVAGPSPELLRLVPAYLAREYRAVPIARRGRGGLVRVAFAEHPTIGVVDHLKIVVGGHLEVVRADPAHVERVLAERYPAEGQVLMGDLFGDV